MELAAALKSAGRAAIRAYTDSLQPMLASLNGIVNREALVMSFNDTFFATGAVILVFLPLVLLLGKVDKSVKVDAGH